MMVLSGFLVFLAFSSGAYAIREALDEEFPFQVSIKAEDQRHLCGGAIITSKWILSVSECMKRVNRVFVHYGTADSNIPVETIESKAIIHQNELDSRKKNRLALIELSQEIKISKTASLAKLPTERAELRNTTKLSGWKIMHNVDLPPSLYAIDEYFVITENCRTGTGTPISLGIDEFCGVDGDSKNEIVSSGTIVSKSAIVLGILPLQGDFSPVWPLVFVKMSKHEQWIRDVLKSDADYVNWVDKVPKDSANSQCAVSLILMGISALFVRYL